MVERSETHHLHKMQLMGIASDDRDRAREQIKTLAIGTSQKVRNSKGWEIVQNGPGS